MGEPRQDAVAGKVLARRSADRRRKSRASAESLHGDSGISGAAADDLLEIRGPRLDAGHRKAVDPVDIVDYRGAGADDQLSDLRLQVR